MLMLAAMLLASLMIAGFVLRLLATQDAALREAFAESDARALALLATRTEQALLARIRPPLEVLRYASVDEPLEQRMANAAKGSGYLRYMLVLDASGRPRASWSRDGEAVDEALAEWLAHAVAAETPKVGSHGLGTVVEQLPPGPVLLVLRALSGRDPAASWVMAVLDLPPVLAEVAQPLLAEFTQAHGGSVELQDAETPWDEGALHEPLNRALPGWLLSYRPDAEREQAALAHGRHLLLAVSVGAVLALLLATFAAWRELHQERALADLRDRFVANVSHELKTPLALIRLHAETLALNRIQDPGRRQAYFDTIVRETERLTDMIDSVLDLERLRRGQEVYRLTESDLAGTVRHALDRYRDTLAQRGALIDVDIAPELPPVAHDPQGVTRILLNLLNNALDHGGGAGIGVWLRREGDSVELGVTDTGVGLSAEELVAIRRAIARGEAAPSRRGSGLGLALVERIARAHRAYLLLEAPECGNGLRAVVTFPTQPKEAEG